MTASNGTAEKARQMFRADPALRREVVAAELGMSARWAGSRKAEVRAEVRNGAADAVPVAATNVAREVTSPARTNGTSQRTAPSPWQRWLRHHDPIKVAATAVVLVVGLAVSYSHIVHLALLAGAGWWAWVMPLPLDAMALVALLHLGTERRYAVAWAGLVVGAVGSLAANVLAVDPSLADMRYVLWGFAALPPIAVVVCGHLLDRGARR